MMEQTLIFIDAGFLSKLSKHFQVMSTGYQKEGGIISRQFEKLMEEGMKKRGREK